MYKMIKILITIYMLVGGTIAELACTYDKGNIKPIIPFKVNSSNLLTNPCFLIGGSPSTQGWYASSLGSFHPLTTVSDTPCVKVVYDIPPTNSCGNTLALNNYPCYGVTIFNYITSYSGTNIFEFSTLAKSISTGIGGSIFTGKIVNNQIVYSKVLDTPTTTWTSYTLTDTITSLAKDSIAVGFSVFGGTLLQANCLYNNIQLIKK